MKTIHFVALFSYILTPI